MRSIALSTQLITAQRYVQLLRRYHARPMSFTRRKEAFYKAYWSHAAERVGAAVQDLGDGLMRIRRGGRCTHVRYHHVDIDSYFNKNLVDDKEFVSRLVRELGLPSPRYVKYSLSSIEAAVQFLATARGPCVVKPAAESSGRGITTHITDRKSLVRASVRASASLSPPALLLEEQHPGESYRLLYLDGTLLHAVKRGRPTVVGDGRSDMRELVTRENARRQSDPVVQSIAELTVDLELEHTLAQQHLGLGSVPAAGEAVVVKTVSNQNSRRDQCDVTAQVNPAYHEFAARVFERLGTHLIGIDVMSVDISQPPVHSASAVLEINIPPGLHYHELVAGEAGFSRVGSAILGYLLGGALAARYDPLGRRAMRA